MRGSHIGHVLGLSRLSREVLCVAPRRPPDPLGGRMGNLPSRANVTDRLCGIADVVEVLEDLGKEKETRYM